ncbi:thiopurine S-methyltransferase [Striga asiatica]|uniref:Thiopurine S-methyltransferase n=1 Tax=Striga asiatica TaxID=4170 RepID=A0A5A7QRQ5_STRAF|nr:thiopurine S-methyltransferase [Striga asiatica]
MASPFDFSSELVDSRRKTAKVEEIGLREENLAGVDAYASDLHLRELDLFSPFPSSSRRIMLSSTTLSIIPSIVIIFSVLSEAFDSFFRVERGSLVLAIEECSGNRAKEMEVFADREMVNVGGDLSNLGIPLKTQYSRESTIEELPIVSR